MVKGFLRIALCCLALLPAACWQKTPGPIPEDFQFKGKPIDPYCLVQDMDRLREGDGVYLNLCSSTPQGAPGYTPSGFYGYALPINGHQSQPYIYYKYLGRTGEKGHVIYLLWSDGDNGQFSEVRVMSVDADGILRTLNSLANGDRCNGGITQGAVVDGIILYSKNLTPFDFVELAHGNDAGFAADGDLQSCPDCCVGEADYQNGRLVSVHLTRNPGTINFNDLKPVDACFFGSYAETYTRITQTLNPADFENFGATFNKRCGPLKR
jgi:hypothetical protein